jgi:hypothetical protein
LSGLYVFALADEPADFFVVARRRIEFVKTDGVYAAVERVGDPPAVSEEALRQQHEIVVRIACMVKAVLPARFGAFVDERELGIVVSQRREAIHEALTLVRGRRQMTARLLGVESPEGPPPATAPVHAATGAEYLESRREALAPRPMPPALRAVADAVRPLVVAERADAGGGRGMPTLYHLIESNHVGRYRKALAPFESRTGDAALAVTGPWPPFAFTPDLWP